MEDPALAKGIVKRQVIRVISPGTVLEENLLDPADHNFLAAVSLGAASKDGCSNVGLAALDISTGRLLVAEFSDEPGFPRLLSEIALLRPAELLATDFTHIPQASTNIPRIPAQEPDTEALDIRNLFSDPQDSSAALSLEHQALAHRSAAMAAAYAQKMNPTGTLKLLSPEWFSGKDFMILDPTTLENLEVVKNRDDGTAKHTLLASLDKTQTAMGGTAHQTMAGEAAL